MAKRKDNTTKLIFKVVIGQTADGKEKLAQRTYSNINAALTDDQFYAVARALAEFQTGTVSAYIRQDASSIVA